MLCTGPRGPKFDNFEISQIGNKMTHNNYDDAQRGGGGEITASKTSLTRTSPRCSSKVIVYTHSVHACKFFVGARLYRILHVSSFRELRKNDVPGYHTES